MVKLITLIHRNPHLTREEFQTHWLECHADFGRRIKPMRRYVQYHCISDDLVGNVIPQAGISVAEPFDGAAVGWFDSAEAMQSAMEDDPNTSESIEDMQLFVDLTRTVPSVTQETIIVEPEGFVPYVLIECLRRRSGMDRAAFQKAWRNHSEIGRHCYKEGLLQGYIQNYTLLDDAGTVEAVGAPQASFDGIAMIYFDTVAKFKELVRSPFAQEMFEVGKKFVDHRHTAYMLTRRHAITDIVR